MAGFSKKQLEKISRRIRHGERLAADLEAIESYRDSLIPCWFKVIDETNRLLKGKLPFLSTGRPKRLKSILRKLSRQSTSVGRIVDLVGLRIVVDQTADQIEALEILQSGLEIADVKDYRAVTDGYRAVHLYVQQDGQSVEVQVRTLPQQLWANECEALGERAKEGQLTSEQAEYLRWLCINCTKVDLDMTDLEAIPENNIARGRNPIEGRLPQYRDGFFRSTALASNDRLFLTIYDSLAKHPQAVMEYDRSEYGIARRDYQSRIRTINEDRFDILLLNSSSMEALQVTHPTYFPF